jgi:hypothetical protein
VAAKTPSQRFEEKLELRAIARREKLAAARRELIRKQMLGIAQPVDYVDAGYPASRFPRNL